KRHSNLSPSTDHCTSSMRVWNVIAWAGRAAPSSRTSGKRNKQGNPKTGLQDKKSAHERETLAPRTKTQLRPVRIVPGPFAPRAVLLQQKPISTPTRRGTRPGCERVPARSHRGGAPTGSSTTKPHPNADNPPPTPPTPP